MSSLHHSEETHANLVARLPEATGKPIDEWFQVVQDGPALTRFEERVHWLQDEHEIPAQLRDRRRARVRQGASRPARSVTPGPQTKGPPTV